jgi:hypothetical protein
MAKFTKLNIAALTGLTLLLLSCANQIPPPGGDEDLIPPEVSEVFPPNGTTNFKEDYIEIEFSEYVETRSVQDAIFISPEISEVLEFDWTGRTLEITFPDSLKPNTTYTITVGTDAVDLNNKNNMATSFIFAFSTGDEIDNGTVRGRVYDREPEGVLITAYKIDGDEINPTETKPDYRSQVDADGTFRLLGLAEGRYRIFALKDDFRDFLYNIGDDEYGSPYKEIQLTDTDSVFVGLNFLLTKEDTIKPDLFNVTMTDKHHFLVEFGEYIDSTRISTENFFLIDSTSGTRYDFNYFFKGRAKAKSYFLAIRDSIPEENDVHLVSYGYFDKYGNEADTQFTSIIVNTSPDTTKNNFQTIETPIGGSIIDYAEPRFIVKFEDGFDTLAAGRGVRFLNKKKETVPFKINFLDNSSFEMGILRALESRENFELELDLSYFTDIAGNRSDSVHIETISTNNELNYSGAYGEVRNLDEEASGIVILTSLDNAVRSYEMKIGTGRDFSFERVLPGSYLIMCFVDNDSDGKYNYGSIYPYEPSDRFHFYPDTLRLRARWPVTDVFLNFPTQ